MKRFCPCFLNLQLSYKFVTITIDGSVGGIGGISSAASPPETAKHGYIGQLTEITNLTATASPAPVNEGATTLLGATTGMDDGTVTAVVGMDV